MILQEKALSSTKIETKGRKTFHMKKYVEEGSDEIRTIIGESIFKLLETNHYDEIKVVDIIKTASIGKTTFYRYYSNKNAKSDAMLFHLQEGFRKFQEVRSDEKDLDTLFLFYCPLKSYRLSYQ